MRGQALLLAGAVIAAGLAAPAPAVAQSYGSAAAAADPWCAQQRQNRMLIGGAIGALAGAVIGRDVAAKNTRTEGTVLGGAAGAAAGAAIGRQTVRCNPQPQQTGSYPPSGGYSDPYGLSGGPTQSSTANCRWGTTSTRDPDGREVRESIYMCRGADGVWRRA